MNDGNGDRAEKRYVIVDHNGEQFEVTYDDDLVLQLGDDLRSLPVGGRFTVTRVA